MQPGGQALSAGGGQDQQIDWSSIQKPDDRINRAPLRADHLLDSDTEVGNIPPSRAFRQQPPLLQRIPYGWKLIPLLVGIFAYMQQRQVSPIAERDPQRVCKRVFRLF